MGNLGDKINIICLESEALKALVKQLAFEITDEIDPWIDEKEAMKLLRVTSKTTFQKYREEGIIESSKLSSKHILYNRQSISNHIESKKDE